MKTNPNPACQGCFYDGGIMCRSKAKKKELQYQKQIEENTVIFKLIHCGERKAIESATS